MSSRVDTCEIEAQQLLEQVFLCYSLNFRCISLILQCLLILFFPFVHFIQVNIHKVFKLTTLSSNPLVNDFHNDSSDGQDSLLKFLVTLHKVYPSGFVSEQ